MKTLLVLSLTLLSLTPATKRVTVQPKAHEVCYFDSEGNMTCEADPEPQVDCGANPDLCQ